MIRGKGSNPRISNVNRPHDPGGGGVARNIPLSSKDTRNDISWKLNMNRYGKPVLSPNYQTDIPTSGRSVGKRLLDKLVPEAHASSEVTRLNPVGRDWIEQPRLPPVRGVGITDTGQTRRLRRKYVAAGAATVTQTNTNTIQTGYNTQNTELVNDDWQEVMRKHRYKKPIRNLEYRQVVSKMDNFETRRTDRTVVADQCTSPVEAIRPDGGPAEGLAKRGLRSSETMEGNDRCVKCHKRKKRNRTGRNSGHVRKLLSARLRPWSGRSPQMLNDLVPQVAQRIPSVVREAMHYEWIGRKSGTDADLPVPHNYLEIPNQILPNAFLQLAEEARELGVIKESSGFAEDVQSGSSQWPGPTLVEVMTTGYCGPFGREAVDLAVIPGRLVEGRPIASMDSGGLLDNKSNYRSDTEGRSEGQEDCFGKPTMASRQNDSPSEGHGMERTINTERRVYTSTGPLGFRVTITDGSEPMEPPGTRKQVVIPRPSVDREGFSSKNNVHRAVTMFSAQPVAAGLSDPIAVHRLVDVHDKVSLEVSGPVGRDSSSEFRQTDVIVMSLDKRWDEDMASRSGTSEHPDDCSGDINGADTTYDESDKLAGEWDPLVKQDIGCQLVRVNKGRDNCLTNLRDISGSSDSGVQSWTEQWENMSDNSMDDSYVDTGDLHRSVSSELARLLYDAPPNTGDEDASGSPGTDGSGTGVLPRCRPEEIFDDDRNLSNDDKTDSEYDSNSDLEGYSDFSDDSSVLGIRKVLRRRVPYRGRAPSPRKGCARAPRTPPVPPRNRAEQEVLEHNSVRSSWRRWSYGWVPEYTDKKFVPFVRELMDVMLQGGERAHMDHVLPKLVQSLVIAARVVRKVPHCQENHRMRRDLMLRLFDEEMEKSYLGWERFPVRNRRYMALLVEATPSVGSALDEVRETFTPPIRRCGRRKGAALRKCLSDTEDYFASAAEEKLWTNRAVKWYQPCL